VRYADDCNIYVRSEKAGRRVMESLTRFIERRLKLQINAEKSAVARPWERSFLGFTVRNDRAFRRCISAKAITRFKDRVRDLIKTIGLFRTKAKNVVALSKKLVEEHAGEVPRTREALEALPGVGRKTANVVLNIAFGEPTIAVDTHIFRVGNRTGMATGKTPFEVETKLNEVVPPKYRLHAHHWLILHGRYVCVARRPLCERCVIADLCKWPGKTVVVGAT